MSYAFNFYDNAEVVAPRITKKAPANTNPVDITSAERALLGKIALQFHGNVADVRREMTAAGEDGAKVKKLRGKLIQGLLNVPTSSIIHQVRATNAALVGVEAIVDQNINAMLQAALLGLRECAEISGVSPFIFSKVDGASRNLVSDERIALKEMALRLGQASRPKSPAEKTRAECLRALVCAAIAAERGLIPLAQQNFGVVLRALYDPDCDYHRSIVWTDELVSYARRWRNAMVKMP